MLKYFPKPPFDLLVVSIPVYPASINHQLQLGARPLHVHLFSFLRARHGVDGSALDGAAVRLADGPATAVRRPDEFVGLISGGKIDSGYRL